MYLKSIEMHGFKSFANKIALDFHNGITGIVGPNGSGKSNVSDAVRWVLGEQSAKQLRGSNMQDVIFSGTENRKPLSYAYVAITMDNSDRMLDIDFHEVTVARRVYRSGESEYLLNGTPCRLKDVHELFYDTGIGKEGYSIIGQGQIEKILSGRPEEKRELFDEAAGIVKFKRRKATALKKLEGERENLVRIRDILSELERQVTPLERQSEKAKQYLAKREALKKKDASLFLLEAERMEAQLKETEEGSAIAQGQLLETAKLQEQIKRDYQSVESAIEAAEREIEAAREERNQSAVVKSRLEGQINVLNEQIKAAELSRERRKSRTEEIQAEKAEKTLQKEAYEAEKAGLLEQLSEIAVRRQNAERKLLELQEKIKSCNAGIESDKNELLDLLNRKAHLQADGQKYKTMAEQVNIRKAQVNQRLLQRKSDESDLDLQIEGQREKLDTARRAMQELNSREETLLRLQKEEEDRLSEVMRRMEEDAAQYHRASSRLESLRNIAERYDGYGNSIRKVMERKEKEPGILGVVSDLIRVKKKYETAIETALGGSIQNIVTRDDATAKRMIAYLKQNRFGRATFLPLTSVKGKGGIRFPEALREEGVIGLAHTLVACDDAYNGVIGQLLGKVVVVDDIDHAAELARKYQYTLSIVTLEGESLRPGGSMTGGAFKNSSNLLGRNREIEELKTQTEQKKQKLQAHAARKEELRASLDIRAGELETVAEALQRQRLLENTEELNLERSMQQKEESGHAAQKLYAESGKLDRELMELKEKRARTLKELEDVTEREAELAERGRNVQEALDEQMHLESSFNQAFSEAQMEEANVQQKSEFADANIARVAAELEKCDAQALEIREEDDAEKEEARRKREQIEEMKKTILSSDDAYGRLEAALKERVEEKERLAAKQKEFFGKREEIADRMADLDKEAFRLNSQKEKLEEMRTRQINYLWEEYELTPHGALEWKEETAQGAAELKRQIASLKEEIRALGDVNVNAIEEYKDVLQRYTFLKAQHDDLVEAEAVLVGIVEELDTGMRRQFLEKFAEIQREFDRAFQELFGGGRGELALVEEEDVLECGIRVIAQPPGKKLQNMILLSGGEKALTAISLLFAIQNLKPSPFCLLDEIEAALDDSNVGRFANYLHKLTKHTQFIVITHRRGTMASADRLYGITMQEKGISTLVSVDLIEHDLDQ